MNQPDVGDVHVNALLTNLSVAYHQEESRFIADKIFPFIFVDKQSDVYAEYLKGQWYRDHGLGMVRAPGTRAALTGFEVDMSKTYRCVNYAIGMQIPDELRANADAVFQLDTDATRLVTQLQLIRRERAFVEDFMKAGVWTTERTGTTNFIKFSDYANSDPFTVLREQIQAVNVLIGRRPNRLIMGELAWRRLVDHPDLLARVMGGATTVNPALMTKQMVASWFELDELLVGEAVYNTAAEGAPDSLATIWDDDILLIYTPPRASLLTPAAGYTFVWKPMVNGNAVQFIRKFRDDPEKRDVVEAHSYIDQALTAADAACIFLDAVD